MNNNYDDEQEFSGQWYDMEESFILFGFIGLIAVCALVYWFV